MAKGQNKLVLYRVVKFPIQPSKAQIDKLTAISANLRQVWNEAWTTRNELFTEYFAPLYEELRDANKGENSERATEIKKELRKRFKENRITLFDQINALTPRRHADEVFASVPRNWQEETLDTLDGSFKSFMALRKNGDFDARPPRQRSEEAFVEITGRSGFKVVDGYVILSCRGVEKEVELRFPIHSYQRKKLAKAKKVKKFTLYRDWQKKFWISLAYEIEKPEPLPINHGGVVYLALGATWIGVVTSGGEEFVLKLWRPDLYWQPKIDSVIARIKQCKQGSRAWVRRNDAKRKMQRLMSAQQKQNQREVAQLLLRFFGRHFVVSDMIVRSKVGKLADSSVDGREHLNWAAQNTGSIARLIMQLEEKAAEVGGSVTKHKPTTSLPPGRGSKNKIAMARRLRDSFFSEAAA